MTGINQATVFLLGKHKQLLAAHADRLHTFTSAPELRALATDYENFRKQEIDAGFNLFLLISDTYRRENFHSDILKALLDPMEKHGQRSVYLDLFIAYLNREAKGKLIIDPVNYTAAKLYRERGRIDILICDDDSKHAVIIENKINRAADMQRQLPRYTEELLQKGYQVDAIVYLLLNYHLSPNTGGWSKADLDMVMPRLICVPANNDRSDDLVNGWLAGCMEKTTDPDTKFILKQYQTLIRWIGKKAMDKQILEQFYKQMNQPEQFATALSVKSMLDELPIYRIDRIVDHFKNNCYPFESVWNWNNKAAVFESFRYAGASFTFDVVTENEFYNLQFFTRQNGDMTPQEFLELLGETDAYRSKGDRLQRTFSFPAQETELYLYLEAFRQKLESLLSVTDVKITD